MRNAANVEEPQPGWLQKTYLSIGKKFGLLSDDEAKWRYGSSWQPNNRCESQELRLATVFSCARLIAEIVGSLPIGVFERTGGGNKNPVETHPAAALLHYPNRWMTPVEFFEASQLPLVLSGNCYSEIARSSVDGIVPVSLTPLRAAGVQVVWRDGQRIYRYSENGGSREIPEENMLHVRGMGDGFTGLTPIGEARNVFELARATEKYGTKFFENSARPGGYLKIPHLLNPEQRKLARSSFEERHQGPENSHKLMLLEGGMEYQAAGIPPEEAQFIESRKYSVIEICRIFRVPPHLVYELDRATFSNIEELGTEFVSYTLRPYLRHWEQRLNRMLFARGERLFAEFNLEGLLRGNTAARSAFYSTALQNGWMSRNEVRAKENMNAIVGGDEFTVQVNLTPLSQLGQPQPAPAQQPVREALKEFEWRLANDKPPAEVRQPINIHLSTPVTMPEQKPVKVDVRVEGSKTEVTLVTPPRRAVVRRVAEHEEHFLAQRVTETEVCEDDLAEVRHVNGTK